MSFSFVDSDSIQDDGNDNVSSFPALTVTAGDLIVIWYGYEGAATSITGSGDATGISVTSDFSNPNSSDDNHSVWAYFLAAPSGGSKTYTLTLGGTRLWKRGVIWQFTPTAAVSFEAATQAVSSSSGTSSSGNITVAGSDSITFGGYKQYAAQTPANHSIGGNAATAVVNDPAGESCSWYRATGAFTGAATGTGLTTDAHNIGIIAFSISSGGGGGATYPGYYGGGWW
jgi:hypothetical protein